MRLAIYEFARARLKTDTSWASEAERKRLLTSLETAIRGVEDFAVRGGDQARIEASTQPPQLGGPVPPEETPGTSVVEIHRPEPPQTVVPAKVVYAWDDVAPPAPVRAARLTSRLAGFWGGMLLLFAAVAGIATYASTQLIFARIRDAEVSKAATSGGAAAITPPPSSQSALPPLPFPT